MDVMMLDATTTPPCPIAEESKETLILPTGSLEKRSSGVAVGEAVVTGATTCVKSTNRSVLPPSVSSSCNNYLGPKLVLCSIVGVTAAAGLTVGRWLIVETGEVLQLFACSSNKGPASGNILWERGDHSSFASGGVVDGIDSDIYASSDLAFGQCTTDGSSDRYYYQLTKNAGEILMDVAASPYLRSAPLILLFISSTALVVGVMLTQREFRQYWSWIQTCKAYGEDCSEKLMTLVGVSNSDELSVRLKEKQVEFKKSLYSRFEQTLECMDEMVLDDVIRKVVKMALEFSMGAMSGVFLYSLPEEMFVDSLDGAKTARRRLIRAADPYLEQIIFRPGGVWEVFPPYLRESLANGRPMNGLRAEVIKAEKCVGSQQGMVITSVNSITQQKCDEESNDDDEYSSNTPQTSPAPPDDVLMHSSQKQSLIYFAQVDHAAGRDKMPSQKNSNDSPRETIANALSATFGDLDVSKLMSTDHLCPHDGSRSDKQESQQDGKHKRDQLQRQPHPPPSPLKFEKYLRRLTMVTSFLFLCHLHLSPSTRRAWVSTAKLLTSIGLASTAIGAGVVSAILSSNEDALSSLASNPVVGMLHAKILDVLTVPPIEVRLPMDISHKVQWMFKQFWDDIRENKRLKATFAFLVLYGMKRLHGKGRLHSGYVKS